VTSRYFLWFKHQFEISRPNVGNNVLTMEGIRGVAVFLVFLVHYSSLSMPWIPAGSLISLVAETLHSVGNAGVDLFFVLSGYLIYGSLISREQPFFQFIKRRIRRIYPAFIAVYLMYLILSFLFPFESKIPKDGALIYLLQNFLLLPGIFQIEPMITVAWSLSYEVFYYVTMPIIVMALRLRTRSTKFRVLSMAFLALLIGFWSAEYDGHLRLLMFMAGIFLYEAVFSGKVRPPSSGVGLLVFLIGLTVMPFSISGHIKIWVLFTSFYLFCLCCFLRPNEWLARWFSWKPLRWLGNMSYSYYLLHGLALKAFFFVMGKVAHFNELGGVVSFLLLLPILFFLTLIPTIMLFLFVERLFSLPRPESSVKTVRLDDQRALFSSQ
jgi:exopolysaccharide production protein ExoZ